jgi:hypothetical protein
MLFAQGYTHAVLPTCVERLSQTGTKLCRSCQGPIPQEHGPDHFPSVTPNAPQGIGTTLGRRPEKYLSVPQKRLNRSGASAV